MIPYNYTWCLSLCYHLGFPRHLDALPSRAAAQKLDDREPRGMLTRALSGTHSPTRKSQLCAGAQPADPGWPVFCLILLWENPPSHFPPSPLTSFCSCGPLSLPRTVAASQPRWEPLLLGSSELTAGASRPGGSVPPLLTPGSSDILGMTSDLALALQKAEAPRWTPCLHSWPVDMKWVFENLSGFCNPRFLSFQCTLLLCPPFSSRLPLLPQIRAASVQSALSLALKVRRLGVPWGEAALPSLSAHTRLGPSGLQRFLASHVALSTEFLESHSFHGTAGPCPSCLALAPCLTGETSLGSNELEGRLIFPLAETELRGWHSQKETVATEGYRSLRAAVGNVLIGANRGLYNQFSY